MSTTTDEEIKLLEKKLELLRQIKELESKVNQVPSKPNASNTEAPAQTGPTPDQIREQEIKEALDALSDDDKIRLFLKRKDLTGPFRGKDET